MFQVYDFEGINQKIESRKKTSECDPDYCQNVFCNIVCQAVDDEKKKILINLGDVDVLLNSRHYMTTNL